MAKNEPQKTIYAIIFKDTQEILTPESFKKYWPNYGGNNLYGWRAPKKVYYKLGHAKTGFSHIPNKLKSKLAIAEFSPSKIIEDGQKLHAQQLVNKEIKNHKIRIASIKRRIKNISGETKKIKGYTEELERLNSKLKELTE